MTDVSPATKVLETDRLILRRLAPEHAEYILELLNEPSFLRYIGDKGVRTLADARDYIHSGPMASYERFGFGLYLTELKDGGVPIGICGLLKRDTLEDVDIGFALSPKFWSKGYAYESAAAVMEHGRRDFGLNRIVAITSADNESSARLLEKIGMTLEGPIRLGDGDEEVRLFAWDA